MITLLALTYMVSYITRINFGAVVSEISYSTGLSKSQLSVALTGSFITYGLGQIFCGVLGDRISPKKMISTGLIITVIMNLLIPLCVAPWQMVIVWSINGLAQAFMWPPMVRLMTLLLTAEEYQTASTRVSWGSSFGTIFVYLISPIIITLIGWKGVFVAAALCAILMLLVWCRKAPNVGDNRSEKGTGKAEKSARGWFSPVVFFVMVAIALQGSLRDGVTTWMPAFVTETFHLDSEIAILTSVVLPIFSVISIYAAKVLYQKKFQNPLTCAGVLYGVSTFAALLLFVFQAQNAAVSLALSALLTGCMHGINFILICIVPMYFARYGNTSTVSGVLNSCTYVGSAISTYGIAALAEQMGWGATIFSWLLIAGAGCVICVCCRRPWQNRFR